MGAAHNVICEGYGIYPERVANDIYPLYLRLHAYLQDPEVERKWLHTYNTDLKAVPTELFMTAAGFQRVLGYLAQFTDR